MEYPVRATSDDFIRTLGVVLTKIVSDGIPEYGTITCFNSMNAPPISDYLVRIARYVNCSNECFVLALVYIDRIMKIHKFSVSVLNIHRLLITSVMLAAKFSDDVYYSNSFYAQVGGIKVAEINLLEAQFLMLIKYQLFVNAKDYENCRKGVESSSTKIYSMPKQGNRDLRKSKLTSKSPVMSRSTPNSYHNPLYASVSRVNGYVSSNPNIEGYVNCRLYTNLGSAEQNMNPYQSLATAANLNPFTTNLKNPSVSVDLGGLDNECLVSNDKLTPSYLMYHYGGLGYPFPRTHSTMSSSTSASDPGDSLDELQPRDSAKSKFDECEAFVNALENRYRDTLKRKCSTSVGVEQIGLVNLKNNW